MDFDKLRQLMVEGQIINRGIKDPQVISVLRNVPRHKFVPPDLQNDSYEDCPLSIGHGQTISQPYIVALMTEALRLKPIDRVLEVGTGSGYQAAILAKLCTYVYTIERLDILAKRAELIFSELGIKNISVKLGDGTLGCEEFAPYEAIMVTAASPQVPQPLLVQLAEGGRLVMPVGVAFGQALTLMEKEKGRILEREICGCSFVPLIGKFAYKDY